MHFNPHQNVECKNCITSPKGDFQELFCAQFLVHLMVYYTKKVIRFCNKQQHIIVFCFVKHIYIFVSIFRSTFGQCEESYAIIDIWKFIKTNKYGTQFI